MSTNDVPGSNPANFDKLAMGAWAEHEDGSLIFVESVEAGTVVYSIFDISVSPPVEYRDAMPEKGFKDQFSWKPDGSKKAKEKWLWHDKHPFDWKRIMQNFPGGSRHTSANDIFNAAQRVAKSLNLRAEAVRERREEAPTFQRAARKIMEGIMEAVEALPSR